MKSVPLQVVVVELEDGRRGAFFGPPMIIDESGEEELQVESIWFSDVSHLPDTISLAQLRQLALEKFTAEQQLRH